MSVRVCVQYDDDSDTYYPSPCEEKGECTEVNHSCVVRERGGEREGRRGRRGEGGGEGERREGGGGGGRREGGRQGRGEKGGEGPPPLPCTQPLMVPNSRKPSR